MIARQMPLMLCDTLPPDATAANEALGGQFKFPRKIEERTVAPDLAGLGTPIDDDVHPWMTLDGSLPCASPEIAALFRPELHVVPRALRAVASGCAAS